MSKSPKSPPDISRLFAKAEQNIALETNEIAKNIAENRVITKRRDKMHGYRKTILKLAKNINSEAGEKLSQKKLAMQLARYASNDVFFRYRDSPEDQHNLINAQTIIKRAIQIKNGEYNLRKRFTAENADLENAIIKGESSQRIHTILKKDLAPIEIEDYVGDFDKIIESARKKDKARSLSISSSHSEVSIPPAEHAATIPEFVDTEPPQPITPQLDKLTARPEDLPLEAPRIDAEEIISTNRRKEIATELAAIQQNITSDMLAKLEPRVKSEPKTPPVIDTKPMKEAPIIDPAPSSGPMTPTEDNFTSNPEDFPTPSTSMKFSEAVTLEAEENIIINRKKKIAEEIAALQQTRTLAKTEKELPQGNLEKTSVDFSHVKLRRALEGVNTGAEGKAFGFTEVYRKLCN